MQSKIASKKRHQNLSEVYADAVIYCMMNRKWYYMHYPRDLGKPPVVPPSIRGGLSSLIDTL